MMNKRWKENWNTPKYRKLWSHWSTNTKRMQKRHSGRPKFQGWCHLFSSAPKSTKLSKICENKMEKNGQGQYVAGMLNRWISETDRLVLVYVADLDWHRKQRRVHPFKRFCAVQNFLRGWNHGADAWWVKSMKYVRNEFTTNALRFSTDGKIFLRFVFPLHLPVQLDRPL